MLPARVAHAVGERRGRGVAGRRCRGARALPLTPEETAGPTLDLGLPPDQLDVAAPRRLEPQQWGHWRRTGGRLEVQAQDDEGRPTAKLGDTLQVFFLDQEEGELRFTTRIGGGGSITDYLILLSAGTAGSTPPSPCIP